MMDTFEFTDADLSANRENKLTPDQHKRINTYIKIATTSTWLALIACIGTIGVFFGLAYRLRPADGFGQELPILILAAFVFMSIFIFFIIVGMIRTRHLNNRHISVTEGSAARSMRKLKHGRWTAYYVTIAETRFQLSSRAQFEVFQDNAHYRVFYIQYPPAHLILSIEQMDHPLSQFV
jgi:uncharacterized membrane protein